MLQFLKHELVWTQGDRLFLYRPGKEILVRDPLNWNVGRAERGVIYADRLLRVKNLTSGSAESFPNAEAILEAGWIVDPS
jgi:hypothetical protein